MRRLPLILDFMLSPARYEDKYQYPVYYNMTGGHYVVQNDGTVKNGIMDASSIVMEEAKVLFNQNTGSVLTQAGGSGQ